MSLTRPTKGEDRITEWRYARASLPPPCGNRSNTPLRASTIDTTYAKYQPVSHVHPSHLRGLKHSLCIHRAYQRTSLVPPYFFLGTTTGCIRILNSTCGYGIYNLTRCLVEGTPSRAYSPIAFPDVKHTPLLLSWPSDAGHSTPQDYVWLCGDKLYQVLAPIWIGTCTLVDLTPAVTVLTSLMYTTHHYPEFQHPDHHKEKRDLTSAGSKFVSGLFPWWGTVNNAHNIDSLHVSLENLTYETTQGFQALTPYIIASRNMLMQHQYTLDLVFASKGGLCHVIGDSCCTYVPDTSKNITDTVLHLNNLLANMKDEDISTASGWDWWSWLTSGGWEAWLARIVTPLMIFFDLLICCTCFIIPLLKKCVSSMISSAFVQYAAIPLQDPMGRHIYKCMHKTLYVMANSICSASFI